MHLLVLIKMFLFCLKTIFCFEFFLLGLTKTSYLNVAKMCLGLFIFFRTNPRFGLHSLKLADVTSPTVEARNQIQEILQDDHE